MTRMKWDAMSCNENVASECFRDNWAWWDDAQVLLQVSFLSCQAPLKFELVGMLLGWHHSCWASWSLCYGKLDFTSSELWCVALFSLVQLCWVPASILGCIWTCCKLRDEETSSRLTAKTNVWHCILLILNNVKYLLQGCLEKTLPSYRLVGLGTARKSNSRVMHCSWNVSAKGFVSACCLCVWWMGVCHC
jgi:hypothetical protein